LRFRTVNFAARVSIGGTSAKDAKDAVGFVPGRSLPTSLELQN
jgi:hypothetical protein